MSIDPTTARLVDELAAESEAYKDTELPDSLPAHVTVTRPNRRTAPVLARRSPGERAELDAPTRARGA